MARLSCLKRAAGAAALLEALAAAAAPQPFVDPINTPAQISRLAHRAPVMALAPAGARLIAAGARGHILWSDDAGKSWQQARVPVSSDLVALSFPTPLHGWAVGHSGVVLHTEDGGKTWQRQLAGLDATRAALKAYEASPPKDPQQVLGLNTQLETNRGEPFLDVHFWNEHSGFVIGTFGSIFRTDDGGRTWQPWMTRMDNPDGLNLFAIHGRDDRIFITGEQGKVWKLDVRARHFSMSSTPYAGTLFGLRVGEPGHLIAYGMRGALLRSTDDGASWRTVKAGTSAGLTSAIETADGRLLIGDSTGNLLTSRDGGQSYVRTPARMPAPIFALGPGGPGGIVIGGPMGLLPHALP